ncbi:MAG: methyl-accepting chemotaxis protein [Schwartzia sp. (in: firmicutes)]
MKLKTKLMVSIEVPLLIILVVTSAIVYFDTSDKMIDGMENQMQALAQFHAEEIQRTIENKEGILDGVAEMCVGGFPDNERLFQVTETFAKRADILALYAGFPDRDVVVSGVGVLPRSKVDATTRIWYKNAAAKDGICYSDVYEDALSKEKVITLSRAVKRNGHLTGVVGVDVSLAALAENIRAIQLGERGEAFLIDDKGYFIARNNKTIDDASERVSKENEKLFLTATPSFFELTVKGVAYYCAVHPVEDTGWRLVLFQPKDEVLAGVYRLRWIMMVGTLLSLGLLGGIVFYAARSVVVPLETVSRMAADVAKGNLTMALSPTERDDEVGSLHNSFCSMATGLRTLIKTTAETAQKLAAASDELSHSSDQSARGAQHTAEAITKITGDAVEQDAVVSESMETVDGITRAMNEITGSIADVSASAQRVATATTEGQHGLGVAVKGMEVLDESAKGVSESVTALYESSKRISEIVEMISSIAGQTNLLALNAAIEAARAGEQGRGFAVVAEEVRKLAEQSANSSQEITALITDNANRIETTVKVMQGQKERVEEGVAQVNEASEKFDRIASVVQELAAQIEHIHQSTEGIKTGSERMVGSVETIKKVSASVHREAENVAAVSEDQAASMEEIAAASQTLAKLAQDLQQSVGRFRV